MSFPPFAVKAAKNSWRWQWNQLMNGLGPANSDGEYQRPVSKFKDIEYISKETLEGRKKNELPHLIIGLACPWAHRTWLMYELKDLSDSLNLLVARADHNSGRWEIDPPWQGCRNLREVYSICKSPKNQRATVPLLFDPIYNQRSNSKLIINESLEIIKVINRWPKEKNIKDYFPKEKEPEINIWLQIIHEKINNGVYKCGFARNQKAYEKASNELISSLKIIDDKLAAQGPWVCGDELTLADIILFPTLIRWEIIYRPLFKCSKEELKSFSNILKWRERFYLLPQVRKTCNSSEWRKDYFGALFPLNPGNIIPECPELDKIVLSH